MSREAQEVLHEVELTNELRSVQKANSYQLKIALLISALLVGHPADAAEVVCKETIYKGIAGVYNPSTSRVEFKETI